MIFLTSLEKTGHQKVTIDEAIIFLY